MPQNQPYTIGNGCDITILCDNTQYFYFYSWSLKTWVSLIWAPDSWGPYRCDDDLAQSPSQALAIVIQGHAVSGNFSIRACYTNHCVNLLSANIQADSTSESPRKLTPPVIRGCMCPLPGHSVTLTDVRLSITRDRPIMDLESCCHFQMQLLAAKKTHGAQMCQMYGNMGNFPAVHMHECPNRQQRQRLWSKHTVPLEPI